MNNKKKYILFIIISLAYIIIDKFIILNTYGWLELIPFTICIFLLVYSSVKLIGLFEKKKVRIILEIVFVLIIVWFAMLSSDYKRHRNLGAPLFNLIGYKVTQDYDMDLQTGRIYKNKSTFYLFGIKVNEITFAYPDCSDGKPTKISKQTYTFTDNNCDIRISYPKIEQDEYKTANNELYTISTSQWMEANGLEKKNLDAVVEYDVTTLNEHIISVKFTGYYMVKGAAHPVDICFASSIDLEHQKPLEIFDFISYESAFQCVQDGNFVIEYGGLKALSSEEQSSRIGNVLMEKDSHNMMQIYIEKENLYFIVGNLSHALGDYSIVCFSETQK